MASHPNRNMLFFITPLICGVAASIFFLLKHKKTSSSSTATCSSIATCSPDPDPPSSSSADRPEIKYDVFINFRGPDVRSTFLSHLREAFDTRKINYFVDDRNLNQGDEISSTLLDAIKKSEISLVLFSEDYVSSNWCLEELERIIQCMENQKQIILPVFYKVDPSTVRHQKEKYSKAFVKHGERFDDGRLQKWKAALKKASDLSGFDSSKYNTQAILIKEIVERVSEKLRKTASQIDLEGFVGIQNHIENLEKLLYTESPSVFIIGIWGMGGVGKITIAEILYNRLHDKYESSHFLCVKKELDKPVSKEQLKRDLLSKLLSEKKENFDNVTLHGIPTWVKTRLNQKKILIVLDDINELDQLEILTGGHEWFGSGSRIIMTSREKDLFSRNCNKTYLVKPLNPEDAAKLFEEKLIKKCRVRKHECYELSKKVLNYAQGVPLAIEDLAGFLYNKNKDEWKSQLKKLEKMPDSKIQNVLKLSYDGLNDWEHREIFLHLACFFRDESKKEIKMLLNACDYHTTVGLRVLQDKALITYCGTPRNLHMHDLIRAMGREIVRQISPKNPGERTHLWDSDDIFKVFKNEQETTKIESIRLNGLRLKENLQLESRAFVRMNNLRLLQFDEGYKVYPPDEGFEWLPNGLRCFNWIGYPSKSFPSRLCLENLVELNFSKSKLQRLWDGVQDLPNLQVIDLHFSLELTEVPDLSKAPNLRRVALRGCDKLRYFGLWPKNNIVKSDFGVPVPKSAPIYKESKESKEDDRWDLRRMSTIPSYTYYVFPSLQFLDLGLCTTFVEFPNDIALCLPSLQKLSLHNTNVKTIPAGIKYLSHLTELIMSDCNQLRYIPELPPSLEFINVEQCRSLETIQFSSNSLPLSHKRKLVMRLEGCVKLDDYALRAVAWYFKLTIQRMISASIKDGYTCLHLSRSKIPNLFDDRYYRVTQDSRSLALVLPLHSEVTGFIFFAFCQEHDMAGIKCHIAYLSEIELRNNVPVLKGHVQFTYYPEHRRQVNYTMDHVCFWYEGSLYLKIVEEFSRIRASIGTTRYLKALVWFELLENKSEGLTNIKEWAVYSNCTMGFHEITFDC